MVILRYIASAAVGKERAYDNSTGMLLLGLLFHYLIAFGLTLFFFWLYPRVRFMQKSRILTAVVYGLFAWCITNLVIVPLSLINKFPSNPKNMVIAALILICMIGLPLAYIIGGYFDRRRGVGN